MAVLLVDPRKQVNERSHILVKLQVLHIDLKVSCECCLILADAEKLSERPGSIASTNKKEVWQRAQGSEIHREQRIKAFVNSSKTCEERLDPSRNELQVVECGTLIEIRWLMGAWGPKR